MIVVFGDFSLGHDMNAMEDMVDLRVGPEGPRWYLHMLMIPVGIFSLLVGRCGSKPPKTIPSNNHHLPRNLGKDLDSDRYISAVFFFFSTSN